MHLFFLRFSLATFFVFIRYKNDKLLNQVHILLLSTRTLQRKLYIELIQSHLLHIVGQVYAVARSGAVFWRSKL